VIHREQIAVTLADLAFAEPPDGVREIEINPQHRSADAATFAGGSLGVALKWIEDGVVGPARDLVGQIDNLFEGRRPGDLPGWFKRSAEAYAEKQMERDKLGSKDAATREGLALYLGIAAEHVRHRMAAADDPDDLEYACTAVDAIARAQEYLDANVNVAVWSITCPASPTPGNGARSSDCACPR
jgi:hypothetical protein